VRIRITATISGTRNGRDWPPAGEEIDVPDVEGAEMCAAKLAEPVVAPVPAERAVSPASTTRAEKRLAK
jgi:hypothetical protein